MKLNRAYRNSSDDWASCVQQTSDEGCIVGASTDSFDAGFEGSWLVKTYPNGTLLCSKTYGGTGSELASSVRQTSDGGYMIAGMAETE